MTTQNWYLMLNLNNNTTLQKIGFTGTQQGMTSAQSIRLDQLLRAMRHNHPLMEFHHGDCIGADEQAARIANSLGNYLIICHPPDIKKKRAFAPAHRVEVAKPYIQRNHDIVDATQLLIGCPRDFKKPKILRGRGDWATIVYADYMEKPVYVIYPDGSGKYYNVSTP